MLIPGKKPCTDIVWKISGGHEKLSYRIKKKIVEAANGFEEDMFDILIKNALIIDGSCSEGYKGDVGIKDGLITAMDPVIESQAEKQIDASGLVLAPGFIDLHTHTDLYHITNPEGEIRYRQGVCLDVAGNCGLSPAPSNPETFRMILDHFGIQHVGDIGCTFEEYMQAVGAAGPTLRLLSLVGHSNIRVMAMGFRADRPDSHEMKIMKRELAMALEQGAVGLSTGLYYPPSGFAQADEIIELAKVLAQKGGFHASHIRNEAEGLMESLDEVIRIGLETGAPTHVSHLKAAGRQAWPMAEKAIELLESARSRGLDLTCDVYPYAHSSTTLLSIIPPWAQEGGTNGLLKRLANSSEREKITNQIKDGIPGWENIYHNAGFDGISIAEVMTPANKPYEGLTIDRAAEIAGKDPFLFTLDLIMEEQGMITIVAASMLEENTAGFIALPFSLIGSDGIPGAGKPHPRLYGTFPRVIRRFVRELKVLSMETAIAKMTGLSAQRLGLKDAGLIKKQYRADLVLFDPETFSDRATFENPVQFPEGLVATIIGGKVVFDG